MLASRILTNSYRRAAGRSTTSTFCLLNQGRSTSKRTFAASVAMLSKVSDEIKHDHRQLEHAYNQVLQAKTLEDKEKWQNQFTWELACHSIGEELVVYPAFERYLVNGRDMADRDRADHKIAKDHLYKFQSLTADDPDFIPTLQSLWANLKQHIESEENHDLVELEKKLDEAESERMAASFTRTKKFTPTRSHPDAPDKPPFETVAGLMAAPIDRLQDLFRKFP